MTPTTKTPTRVVNIRTEEYDVYIGRACPRRGLKASKFANPFKVGPYGDRTNVIRKFIDWIAERPDLIEAARTELQGKRLGCWCFPCTCHGDVLAALADGHSIQKVRELYA